MQFEMVDPLQHQYVPDSNNLDACYEFGRDIGRRICAQETT
jgi:flavorubredoxin